jgi:hypothetical protein
MEETIIGLIEEYIEKEILECANPYFHEKMVNDISTIVYETFIDCFDFIEIENIETIVRDVSYFYFSNAMKKIPARSNYYDLVYKPHNHEIYDIWEYSQELVCDSPSNVMETKIQSLKEKYQPEQRTKEWLEYRYGLLSASIISKIFCSNAQFNSIVYEKCKPLNIIDNEYVGGSRQWGVKYEPVSIQLYETMNHTTIEALGCIQHELYPFIGASPDGINTDIDSNKYGTLIEVKNIVNRDITGIPSKEYWIQMQIQMETCDLDRCDFIETRFKEYTTVEEYLLDETREYKGIILQLLDNTYVYSPLNPDQEWMDTIVYENMAKVFYWYLDEYSCILVERNRPWFHAAVIKIKECWNVIENVRTKGEYEKYSPKQRNKGICVIKLAEGGEGERGEQEIEKQEENEKK